MKVTINYSEEDSFECIGVSMPDEKRGISYVIITIDKVDDVLERGEYGDWECNPQHLEEMKEKFFEVNRKISHIQGGNDTPRHNGEDIEVLFADDPFDGYVAVKVLIFNTERYKITEITD